MMMMMNTTTNNNNDNISLRRKRKLSDYLNDLTLNDTRSGNSKLDKDTQNYQEKCSRYDNNIRQRLGEHSSISRNKKVRTSMNEVQTENNVSKNIDYFLDSDPDDDSDSDAADTIKLGTNMFIDKKYIDPLIVINSDNIQEESKRIYDKIVNERKNNHRKSQKVGLNPLLEGVMSLAEFQKKFRDAYGDKDGDFDMLERQVVKSKDSKQVDVSNGEILQRYYLDKNYSLVVWNEENLNPDRVVWEHWQKWMNEQIRMKNLQRIEEMDGEEDEDMKMFDDEDPDVLIDEV